MHLRELLDEVATANEPPSRLTADDVYAAGRRRRRTTAGARWGTAAFGVALVVSLVVVTAPARAPDTAGPVVTMAIEVIGGYDLEHLYAVVRPCTDCEPELRTTTDAGRTWTKRGTFADVNLNLAGPPAEIRVTRAGAVGVFGPGTPADGRPNGSVSLDRGRSFAQLTRSDIAVDGAPTDALISCDWRSSDRRCVLAAVDLDAGSVAPLATQPALEILDVTRAAGGVIWVLGRDDGTRLPAVASSTDGGRIWTTFPMPDIPGFTAESTTGTAEIVADDNGAVVWLRHAGPAAAGDFAAFRLTGSGWQRLDRAGAKLTSSYLAADGTHVVLEMVPMAPAGPSPDAPTFSPPRTPWSSGGPPWSSGPAQPPSPGPTAAVPGPRPYVQYWACPPGETAYRAIDPPAGLLGDGWIDITRLPGGGYLANGTILPAASVDGLTWRSVLGPPR